MPSPAAVIAVGRTIGQFEPPRLRPSRSWILRMSAPTASSRGCRRASPKPSRTICARPARTASSIASASSKRCAGLGVDLAGLRKELRLDLAVVGSFQRAGDRLRITARVVDAGTGEALAEAKADGALAQVFELQDRIVAQFAETLGSAGSDSATSRRTYRETSSLEAYQAFTEGRVRLESLDASLVSGAIADFERAIALDPRYALAHVGLANARFWQYEMSRARNQPEACAPRPRDRSRSSRNRARDEILPKPTQRFRSCWSAPAASAKRWRRHAVPSRSSLRTGATSSGSHTRSGVRIGFGRSPARWNCIRISRSRTSRPRWCTSRGDRSSAPNPSCAKARSCRSVRRNLKQRYPAKGLHWLLGLVRLARGDEREARTEFDREIAIGSTQLYAAEFAMNAYDGAGFVALEDGDTGRSRADVHARARAVPGARAIARRARVCAGQQRRRRRGDRSLHACRSGDRLAPAWWPHKRSDHRGSLHAVASRAAPTMRLGC